MTRTLLVGLIFASLSAWVSAQPGPATPSPAEQLRLMQANRPLLDALLEASLKVSEANSPLLRADACRTAVATLGSALRDASADQDANPDRVIELSDHLTIVVTEGLAPTLAQARQTIPPGSPDFERLKTVQAELRQDLDAIQRDFPGAGKANAPRLNEARGKLAEAVNRLELK